MIEPYNGKREPLRLAVYDLEWIPGTYEVRLVGVRDERGFRSYPTVLDFLRGELTSKNRGKVFFAHAGGLADVQFLLAEVIKRANPNFRVEGSWSGSSLIRCKVVQGKHAWTFADSFWLLRDSLERIGKSVGLEKLSDSWTCPEAPACGHEGKCVFYAPEAILRTYNERDCEILWLALHRFQDEILELGGKLRQTIASTALTLFRSAYLSRTIATDERVNELTREAYVASRVEVFERHAGKARGYDINSSFPHSMTHALPGELMETRATWRGEECAIVDATVSVEHEIPPVPIRTPAGRVFFPCGRFRRRMTGDDLHLLLEAGGRIEAVHEAWIFRPFYDLANYVRDLYELRRTTDDPFRKVVAKYLMNSCYGKFAEAEEKSELQINPPKRPKCKNPKACRGRCSCVEVFAPGIYKVGKVAKIAHAHVPIAAVVTAKSRALLTRSLWAARPYYCDTDSNYTSHELEESDELGRFKLEKEISGGTFLSPKLYRTWPGPTIRSKGFRKLSTEEFDALAQGDGIAIRRMVRIAENFRSGAFQPRDEEFVKHALSHLSEKELRAAGFSSRKVIRPKRCTLEDGKTRPWHVSELEGECE